MCKKAVLLAGGLGTRLRPYTTVLPKPLMPIGDYPILEVIIRQLKKFNITDISIAVNHQAELIQSFFGDGEKLGVRITYSLEAKPLSTMGPLKLVDHLPENFLVMNGDVLTDLNFSALLNTHINENRLFTIASMQRTQKIDYGVLEINNNQLVNFIEKPENEYNVSMGVYAVNRDVLNFIPDNQAFGFDDLMYLLLKKQKEVHIYKHNGLWLDIGRPDDYMQAIDDFEKDKGLYLHE